MTGDIIIFFFELLNVTRGTYFDAPVCCAWWVIAYIIDIDMSGSQNFLFIMCTIYIIKLQNL